MALSPGCYRHPLLPLYPLPGSACPSAVTADAKDLDALDLPFFRADLCSQFLKSYQQQVWELSNNYSVSYTHSAPSSRFWNLSSTIAKSLCEVSRTVTMAVLAGLVDTSESCYPELCSHVGRKHPQCLFSLLCCSSALRHLPWRY